MDIHCLTPQDPPKGYEKEMGYYAVKDGVIYINSRYGKMNGAEAIMKAGFDGTPIITEDKYTLIPESMARTERKDGYHDVIDAFVGAVKKFGHLEEE